jgi:hypothetical protein
MNPRRFLVIVIVLSAAAVVSIGAVAIQACGVAPPRNTPVAIASETALIIWDEKNETQHFIRRASFTTEAKDFGFLVPTPTKPDLAEADDEAFKTLAKITEPRVVEKKREAASGCIGCAAAKPGAADKAAGVELIGAGSVSGFDYAILKTTDADDLADWLEKHKYEFSPELKEWAKHYIDAKWLITAFKVSKDKDGKEVATKAVRMTFQTKQPFFPYREPESKTQGKKEPLQTGTGPKVTEAPTPPRLLRIYFISTGKVKGTLGDKGQTWPGKTAWANKIEKSQRDKVLDLAKLPKDTGPDSWWLTEFEDPSSPRPGNADVFFGAADDQNPVEREPHVRWVANPFPDVMTFAMIGLLTLPPLVRRIQRRKSRK